MAFNNFSKSAMKFRFYIALLKKVAPFELYDLTDDWIVLAVCRIWFTCHFPHLPDFKRELQTRTKNATYQIMVSVMKRKNNTGPVNCSHSRSGFS